MHEPRASLKCLRFCCEKFLFGVLTFDSLVLVSGTSKKFTKWSLISDTMVPENPTFTSVLVKIWSIKE